jgi:hypothetical protein
VKGEWVQTGTHNASGTNAAYHGCWGYRRDLIETTLGYKAEYAGDDQEYDRRLRRLGYPAADIASRYLPFYWYNRPLPGRISERGGSQKAYVETGNHVAYVGKLPEWKGEEVWKREIPAKKIIRHW